MNYFLFFFSIFLCASSYAQTVNRVQEELNEFIKLPKLKAATISFKVIDLSTDSIVASYHPNQCLTPASTTKLFTTATAFRLLGKDYRPATYISYTGKIDSAGVLNGNIIVTGCGDPTLGSRYFTQENNRDVFLIEWVNAIKKVGIKSIKGTVIVDGSSFGYHGAPSGWTWGDMGNYYGAGPSGIVIYDNMTSLYFSTGDSVGNETNLDSIRPVVPNLKIDNRVLTADVRGDNAYVFGAPFSYDWFVEGELPLNKTGFRVKASTPDPEMSMANALFLALKTNEIDVFRPTSSMRKFVDKKNLWYDDTTQILKYAPHTLEEITTQTNHKSINLFAEEILGLIGYAKTGLGSTENGVKIVEDYWKNKIDISTIRLTDGSGLSRTNAISSSHFTALLQQMANDKAFINTLPVSGKSGTLYSVCRNEVGEGNIHAKSGTLSRVKAYAGYVYTQSGKKLAFAIIVNHFLKSSHSLVNDMEAIFNAMVLL